MVSINLCCIVTYLACVTTANAISVNVARNLNLPEFIEQDIQQVEISNSVAFGLLFLNTTATNASGDHVTSSTNADKETLSYFQLDRPNGVISVKQSNLELFNNTLEYKFTYPASSNGISFKVSRNMHSPEFTEQDNYQVEIRNSVDDGEILLNVTVTDANGDSVIPATADNDTLNYFQLDRSDGNIYVKQTIPELVNNTYEYKFLYLAYITLANGTSPVNEQYMYKLTITDSLVNGTLALNISATDANGVFLTFPTSADNDTADYFQLDRAGGMLYIRQTIMELFNNEYRFTYLTCVAMVAGNLHAPIFEQTMYNATTTDSVANGTLILTITAFDADGGVVTYSATSDDDALNYFNIDRADGVISVKQPIPEPTNNTTEYMMVVIATVNGQPARSTSVDVFITVNIG